MSVGLQEPENALARLVWVEIRKRGVAQKSQIEWTDATWNPVTGCTKIWPGCDNCYAERFAERRRRIEGHPYEQGFELRLWPSRLGQPAQWKKPRMIFVNSMSDLFHEEIPTAYIDAVFDAMGTADWQVYQVLTKRSSIMCNYVNRRYGGQRPHHISGLAYQWKTAPTKTVLNICVRSIRTRGLSHLCLSLGQSVKST